MIALGENLWVHEDAMDLMGGKLPLRMTVIKLADGGLWIHSPTAITMELREQIVALGPVKFLIAPNNWHYLSLQEWINAFPTASLFVTPRIVKKLKLKDYALLDESTANPWEADLERVYLAGVPFFSESVFLHKKTQSIIVTDFIQHYLHLQPENLRAWLRQTFFEFVGFKGICIAPPLRLGITFKNRASFKSAVQAILNMDFRRIIVTHGPVIDTDAKGNLARLCERFLR